MNASRWNLSKWIGYAGTGRPNGFFSDSRTSPASFFFRAAVLSVLISLAVAAAPLTAPGHTDAPTPPSRYACNVEQGFINAASVPYTPSRYAFAAEPGFTTAMSALATPARALGSTGSLRGRFGVVSAHLQMYDPQEMEREMDALAGAGIEWLRCSFPWFELEPARGSWNFAGTDLVVEKASERGIRILGILASSPPWANGGNDWNYPPTDIEAWRTYVSTVAARYSGTVEAWEVWNEQNIDTFWKPWPDSGAYVNLLAEASPALRAAAPEATVVMGGVAGLDPDYLNACLAAGAADHVDAIAYHPYPETLHQDDYTPQEQRCRDIVGFVRWLVSVHSQKPLEVWITEIGWTTCADSPPGVDTGTQASYMLRTLLNYASTDADMVFWYNLRDEHINDHDRYGLRYINASEKLSYRYYRCFESEFGGTVNDSSGAVTYGCARPETLEAHAFVLPDGGLRISAWKSDDADDSLTVTASPPYLDDPLLVDPSTGAATPVESFSRDGAGRITISGLSVGKTPVMLRFDALSVPRVNSVTPSRAAVGTKVTVRGSDFGSSRRNSYVTFGGRRATAYGYWSNGRVVAEVPAGAVTGSVKITTSLGTSNGVRFTVEQPPPPPPPPPPPAPDGQATWYLAEGSTAWGFDTTVSILNPCPDPLTAGVMFNTAAGPVRIGDVALAPASLTCINPRDYIGDIDFSTAVECREGRAIAVERRMSWLGEGYAAPGAHSSIGVNSPAETWYLPEGSTDWGFECWLLIQNPGDSEAVCRVTYMVEDVGPMRFEKSVPARSRASFNVADDVGAADTSIMVESDVPVIPERAMYTPGRREGHNSAGYTAPARELYLAEGTTGWGFTTYVLLQNPGDNPATVTVTYMTGQGPLEQPSVVIPPHSRKTIRVNDVLPPVDFSTRVRSDLPVTAERAMYWETEGGTGCHDSTGTGSPHRVALLPGGITGGAQGFETWTLVQNPGTRPARVRISYLVESGGGNATFEATVPAGSRATYRMNDRLPDCRAGVTVECLDEGAAVIAETATYSADRRSGTNTIGGFTD